PAMKSAGYRRLVRSLVENQLPASRELEQVTYSADRAVPRPPATVAAAQPPTSEAAPWDLTPAGLRMLSAEADFLERLAPLLQTPREAKRMVNLYRVLKVSLPTVEAARLTTGQVAEFPA